MTALGLMEALRRMVAEGMGGMAGVVGAGDEVRICTVPAVKVLCVHCRTHVYWLKSAAGGARLANLAPVAGRSAVCWSCPACGSDIRAYGPATVLLKTERGYLT